MRLYAKVGKFSFFSLSVIHGQNCVIIESTSSFIIISDDTYHDLCNDHDVELSRM